MIRFSVVLLTYNSNYNSIIMTLESVIRQRFSDFEIVIADDASDVDYLNEIKSYFIKKNFCNYQLIKNKSNVGTVMNAINAIKKTKGKYIKCLGAGDLLFDEHTLKDMYLFLDSHGYKSAFGIIEPYAIHKKGVSIRNDFNFFVPKLLRLYKKKYINRMDRMRILTSLIYRFDCICGASMFFERKYLLKYLNDMKGYIKYAEDYLRALIFLDHDRMYFLNKKVVWYEVGTGISSSGKTRYKWLLLKDYEGFLNLICRKYKKDIIVKKTLKVRRRESSIEKISNYNPILKYIEDLINSISITNIKKERHKEHMKGFLNKKSFLDSFQLNQERGK